MRIVFVCDVAVDFAFAGRDLAALVGHKSVAFAAVEAASVSDWRSSLVRREVTPSPLLLAVRRATHTRSVRCCR
jgi:hypothetical protein